MGHIVSVDKKGRLVYDGLLSSQEKATIDEILEALKNEIPQIEEELRKEYGQSVWYKYYLGLFLGDLLEKYDISFAEQRQFWDEIKFLATKEERKRDEGVNSVHRSFYQQCYILSQQNSEVVGRLSWRQWQDILDRVSNREDERIFEWIRKQDKIREDDWREFEKGLHLFLKKKDTSVFGDDELFLIYDSLFQMAVFWRKSFLRFAKDNPKSAKIKSKARRSKKFQSECLRLRKELKKELDERIFKEAFENAMI